MCEKGLPPIKESVLRHNVRFLLEETLQELKWHNYGVVKELLGELKDECDGKINHTTKEEGKNWYFEGDELVIKKGKWVIDRYKKHDRLLNSLEEK